MTHVTISRDEFHTRLRAAERCYNAGCTTSHDPATDTTTWHVGSVVFGTSKGIVGDSSDYQVSPITAHYTDRANGAHAAKAP